MKNITKIIYLAGIVLNQDKLKKIINVFDDNNMPNIYCHHMTIQYGNIYELPEYLGMEFNFNIEKLVFNKKAIAVSGNVSSPIIKNIMEEVNQHAHITICTAQGVPPVYSNELLKVGKTFEYKDTIILKVGAFVVFEDNSTGWIFDKNEK